MTLNASNCKKNILVIIYKAFNSFKNLNEHPSPSPKYQQVNRKAVMQNAILLKNL